MEDLYRQLYSYSIKIRILCFNGTHAIVVDIGLSFM